MASLGNIDTGGFSEAGKAAMMDSDYFKPKKNNPFSSASNFLKNQISKLNKPLLDTEDSSNAFLKDYLMKSYRPEEKSSQDKIADLIASRIGASGVSGVQDVGGGLRLAAQAAKQPIIIPGDPGGGGIGGAISGAASGFLGSGFNPLGAVVGGIGGLFG